MLCLSESKCLGKSGPALAAEEGWCVKKVKHMTQPQPISIVHSISDTDGFQEGGMT